MNDQPTVAHATSYSDAEPGGSSPPPSRPALFVDHLIRDLGRTICAIVLVFLIQQSIVQNYRVQGASMEPSFHTDQYIFVNKLIFFHGDTNALLRWLPGLHDLPPHTVYPFRMPRRGDVVVVREPTPARSTEPPTILIKRVIALPGETVEIKDGLVYINGQPLQEGTEDGGYIADQTECYGGLLCQPYVVPVGKVVVMGDHRSNSRDSRSWQADPGLPLDRIIGKAWVSYWPRQAWGVIPDPAYAQPTP